MFNDTIYYVTIFYRDTYATCLVYGMDLTEFVVAFRSRMGNRLPQIQSALPISTDEYDELREFIGLDYIYEGNGEITE